MAAYFENPWGINKWEEEYNIFGPNKHSNNSWDNIWKNSFLNDDDQIGVGILRTKNGYYDIDGYYLGSDDVNENIVYISSNSEIEKNKVSGKINWKNVSKEKLKGTHEDFVVKCSTVYAESSIAYGIFSKEEIFAIASVHLRNKIAFGKNLIQLKGILRNRTVKETILMK